MKGGGLIMPRKLFSKDFTLLWLGMSISQLGDGAGFIGLMWWIQTRTGSALVLGLMAMVRGLVNVALGPVGGVIADRLNKRTIIIAMDTTRGSIYASLAYLAFTDQLTTPLLLFLVGLNSACSVFFNPSINASVPLLVAKSELPRANSLMQITGNIVSIIGYSAGGILAATIGTPLLLLIDSVSFLLSAVSELFIVIPTLVKAAKAGTESVWEGLKIGFSYVRNNMVLFRIIQLAAIINFVSAPFFILLPKYVQHTLHGSPALYGYIMAATMAGTLGASLIIATTKWVERNLWAIKYGLLFQGISMVLMISIPRQWPVALIGIFLASGLINGLVNIYFGALMQRITAPEHLGKTFGLVGMMSGALQPLSQGLSGWLGDVVSLPVIYLVSGLSMGGCGISFCTVPHLDDFLSAQSEQAKTEPEAAAMQAAN